MGVPCEVVGRLAGCKKGEKGRVDVGARACEMWLWLGRGGGKALWLKMTL